MMDTEALASIIAQLGVSGLFVFIAWRLYLDCSSTTKEKDNDLKDLNNKVLEAFNENTKAITEMKGTMKEVKDAVDNNTNALKTLSEQVWDVIKKQ